MGPSGLIYLACLAAVFLLAVWASREPGAPMPDWMPIDWWPFDSRSDAVEAAIEDQRAATTRSGAAPWRQRQVATGWRERRTAQARPKR